MAIPMPVHLPPARAKRTESGIGVSGVPQPGQVAAWSETSLPHPEHLMSAILRILRPGFLPRQLEPLREPRRVL